MNILLKNGRAIGYENTIDVLICDGEVTKISENITEKAEKVLDCSGLLINSGLIDVHVHLREPGFERKETIASGTKAALKGGFSAVCCMPNTKPVCDNETVVIYIKDQAKKANNCRVYPIGAITKESKGVELAEIACMRDAGIVGISDDGNPVENARMMRLAMEYASAFDIPVISHCEDKSLSSGGLVNEGYFGTYVGLNGINRASEEIMVAREIILAEALKCRIHIAHVSTRGSVELVREAKRRGVKVTCETCPHYFVLDDSILLNYDANCKVNPPIREADDRIAIIEGIKDGTIDCIVTDHAPHHKDEKEIEFLYAANGISGIETSFALANTYLVKTKQITMDRLMDLMCYNPSKIFGLKNGKLAIGCTDISVLDTETKYKIDVSKFISKGKNSPFNGFSVRGMAKYVIIEGRITECEKL